MKRRYKRLVALLLLSLLLCGSTINVFADEPANTGGDTSPASSTASSGVTTNSNSGNNQINSDSHNQNGSGDDSQNGDDSDKQNGDDSNKQNGDDANNQNGDNANNQNANDNNNQNANDNNNQNGDDVNNQNGDDNQNGGDNQGNPDDPSDPDDPDNPSDPSDPDDPDNLNDPDDPDDPDDSEVVVSVERDEPEYRHIHGEKKHEKIVKVTTTYADGHSDVEYERDTEECSIEYKVDGDYLKEYCPVCDHTYERGKKSLIPDVYVTHIDGKEVRRNHEYFHYFDPVEYEVEVSCESVDSPEDIKVYILAYDFSDPFGEKTKMFEATCKPEEDESDLDAGEGASSDGTGNTNDSSDTEIKGIENAIYTCNVGERGSYYNVIGAIAINDKWSKGENEYIGANIDHSVINCLDSDNTYKSSARVVTADGWTTDADDRDNKWYSSKVHGDALFVNITGSSEQKYEDVRLTFFDENGKNIELPLVEESVLNGVNAKAYQNEHAWEGKLTHKEFEALNKTHGFFMCNRDEFGYGRTFILPANKEGKHTYKYTSELKISGRWRNVDDVFQFDVYTDNTDPVLNLTYNGAGKPNGSAGAEPGFYNNQVEVVATVTESNLINEEQLENLYLYDLTSNTKINFTEKSHTKDEDGKKVYTFTATAASNGKYQVKGFVKDLAGNRCAEVNEEQFTIDKEVPKVEITFDNDQVLNEKYYKADRTATITVTDENFGTDDKFTDLALTEKTGKANASGWENAGGDKYVKKITFDQDGTYSFTLTVKDKAGNSSEKQTIAEFVIDKKAPEFEVSFDNNAASNENYYKSARKATITVKESSFSDSLVSITKMSDGEITGLPSVSGFTGSEDSHDATINFEADGKYGFVIKCTDLAGNESSEYSSGTFYIDTQAPEIEITGVANKSANNGAVTPVIKTTDKNINRDDITITLTGSNGGNYPATLQESAITDGFTFSIADIPHEKKFDDLYKLTVKTVDKAGNEKENVIDYSVNRFGSVFVLAGGTKELVDGYYVRKPQNVVIEEINVDKIANREVSVAFDGSYKALKAGRDYSASEDINANGWHLNSYTIFANNFNNDGLYSVDVRTEDEATNRQSSQTREADIKFLVDATAPSIVVSGIEDGGKYVEDSHDFAVNATDTIGVSDLKVSVDGKEVVSLNHDQLESKGGTEIITLDSKDSTQEVVVVSHDVAGNETRLAYNVVVSLKAEQIDIEYKADETEGGSAITTSERQKKILKVVGAIAGVGGLGAAGAGGVNIYRRKFK